MPITICATIDELLRTSVARSLEVERDDASFRNLELEDKVAGYAKLVESDLHKQYRRAYAMISNAWLCKKLNPQPEPEKKVEPELLPSVEPIHNQPILRNTD